MHSKSCCALFLLALVACQAAPSSKILEKKSISETETKLTKDLAPEETGTDKDRAKKSTTFCIEVHSGKEELVPCSPQKINKLPNVNLKNLNEKLSANNNVQLGSDPTSVVQYPSVSNVVFQPPQLLPNTVQHPSNVFVQPNFVQVPVQTQPPQSSVVHSASISQVQSQSLVPSLPPTPIINIIPAPPSAPCEKPNVSFQPAPQPPQLTPQPLQPTPQPPQPTLQPPKPAPQPTKPAPQPTKLAPLPFKPAPPKLQIKPEQWSAITHPEINFLPIGRPSCKSEVLLTPINTPVEYVYHKGHNNDYEYVPKVECSCRSEKQNPSNQLVFYTAPRSSMIAEQYNPNTIGSEDIFVASEMEGRHHKKKLRLHPSVQYPDIYSCSNNPPKYESTSYLTTYNIGPYTFSRPYETYDSYFKEMSSPYSNVPLIDVKAGGPFYRNSKDQTQEATSNNEQEENVAALPVEKENK